MSVTKNLGGDRIGSGAKMNVEIHGFDMSTHDITQITRTTQAVGTLVPIFKQIALKGEEWELDLNAMVITNPTEGLCMGKYKLQIDVFSAPFRLYQGKLHMNMQEQGTKMYEIKFPQLKIVADKIDWNKDPNNQQIGSSCILSYLGTRGIGDTTEDISEVTRYRNAMWHLMYVDAYGNYYANQQEKVGYVIHNTDVLKTIDTITKADTTVISEYPTITPTSWGQGVILFVTMEGSEPWTKPEDILLNIDNGNGNNGTAPVTELFTTIEKTGTGYKLSGIRRPQRPEAVINWWKYAEPNENRLPEVVEFPLANINEMRMDILAAVRQTTPFIIDNNSIAPYGLMLKKEGEIWSKTTSQEGLLLKTYQSDILNNWLDSEAIDEINERSRIQIDEEGGFTMETFLLNEKLYSYLNRVQVLGNTVDDWEEAITGRKNTNRTEKPVYEGGASYEIEFDGVVSTAATEEQPLGKIAGTGKIGNKRKGGKISIKMEENGMLLAIASITPLTDYWQGNDWDGDLETYEDIHKAPLDKIGFQNLPTDWMASWDTKINPDGTVITMSAGKQPSWSHYQTNINKVYGLFAEDSEGWMVNRRKYIANKATKSIANVSTYIDPAEWNDIFAYKNRDAMNYKMQYYIGAKARRIMSANQIPNL